MLVLQMQGTALAADPVVLSATGTLGAVSELSVVMRNVADNSVNVSGLGFSGAAGATIVQSPQYLDISFNDNSVGFQAITISTNNRDNAASPKYTGPGIGSGLIGATDTRQTAALRWGIFDDIQNDGTGATIVNANGFFVSDKGQAQAAQCQDNVSGAFESGADCDADDPTIDWDGNGSPGAGPYSQGFASMAFGLAGTNGDLSIAGIAPATTARKVTDGNVKAYLSADYNGAEAQTYSSNTLTIEMITIS